MKYVRRVVLFGLLIAAALLAGRSTSEQPLPRARLTSAPIPELPPNRFTVPELHRTGAAADPGTTPRAVTAVAQAVTPAPLVLPAPLPVLNPRIVGTDKQAGAGPRMQPAAVLTSQLILKLAAGADPADVAKKLGLQPVSALTGLPQTWVFAAASVDAAEKARVAAASDVRVESARNNRLLFLSKFFAPNDTLYGNQWHLPAANVPAAWTREITGAGVIMAIVDDGCDFTHEDLAANFSVAHSRNFGTFGAPDDNYGPNPAHDNDPNKEPNNHGTAVSGVAAAVGGNGIGVTGAAPKANFGINRLDFNDGQPESNLMQAVTYLSSAGNTAIKIKNHSYGFSDTYVENVGEANAVSTSASSGTIHVYAAGNYRGTRVGDSNKMMPQNSGDAICVAALGSNNVFASYSNYGSCVHVTAPSSSTGFLSVTTTDRTGTVGYTTGNYDPTFGGTSAAAPLVSGIMALAKQCNPNMNIRMAQHALALTSDQVDAGDASAEGGWVTNNALIKFNPNYGFGRINADNFIKEVVKYSGFSESTTSRNATFNIVIPDNNATGVEQTFNVTSTVPMTFFEVTMNLEHNFRGDLEIFVTSPHNTVSRLIRRANSGTLAQQDGFPLPDPDFWRPGFDFWTFRSNAFWGENPAGTWKIKVADLGAPDVGSWKGYTAVVHHGVPVLDTNPPAVSSIVRAGTNPTNANPIVFTVNFDEYVTGVDAADFSLTTTGTVAGASVLSVAGGVKTYTVTVDPGSGEGTIKLNLVDNDTIVDGNSNPLGGTGAGNGSYSNGEAYTVDRVQPTITVTSSTANGGYAAGAQINITLNFSKPVTLSGGNLVVTLDTGTDLLFTPFNNGTSASATYTVAPGDTSPDLTVAGPLVLLGGATLRDVFGNNCDLAIPPAQNLAMFRAILVDAVGPTSGTVFDGFSGADIDVQNSFTTISAHWSGFTDVGSGITGYRWAIGTAPGATNIQPYTDVGLNLQASTSMANQSLSLTAGTNYFVTVEARDGVGTTSITTSDGVQCVGVNATIPEPPARLDALAQSATQINVVWPASPTGGVTYRVWYKTSAQAWTAATLVDSIAGLNTVVSGLTIGVVYDFQVRAVLNANESAGVFGSGSPANAITINGAGNYANIPTAIAAAVPGDTITVVAGTYSVNLTLPAGITLTGVSPHFTILQAANAAQDVITVTGAVQLTTVAQMTVMGGTDGVDAGNSNVLLRNLIIRSNSSNGVSSTATGTLQVVNCTIAKNGGAGILALGPTTVRNTIATGNALLGISVPLGAAVTYNDSYANTGGTYSAGVDLGANYVEPATFANYAGNDYTETLDSFSIDRGDPNDACTLEPDYNGGRINLGAFGNTSRAATSPLPPPSGGGGGGGGCGLTGLEGLLLVAILRAKRR